MDVDPHINVLTRQIIGGAIEVHRYFGPGLLESSYAESLEQELAARRLRFERQRPIPLVYKGAALSTCYRIDLLVQGLVIVEIKCVDQVHPLHKAQLLTYLRLARCPVGLLINFKVAKLTDGITRLINTH